MNQTPLIRVDQVSKTFLLGETTVNALRGVSLSINQGGMVALMGPSGSGKSTLLNLIGALDSPSQGEIVVGDRSLGGLNADERAEFRNVTVGFVFQNFNLIPVLTTFENVILPCQLSHRPQTGDYAERAKHLLQEVGLGEQIHQSVNRLSGGQMQRVALARALINKPRLILADEPTANLDHKTADTVLKIMKALCKKELVTIVVATHDQAVLEFCDRIITLRDGSLISDNVK